jgi:hypothetical protein
MPLADGRGLDLDAELAAAKSGDEKATARPRGQH